MARLRVGDTVKVTSGKYKGMVGEWRGRGDVWVRGVGNTACVPERILEVVEDSTPHADAGGRRPRELSGKYKDWQEASKTEEGRDRYSRENFQGKDVNGNPMPEQKGWRRAVFGKYNERSRDGF